MSNAVRRRADEHLSVISRLRPDIRFSEAIMKTPLQIVNELQIASPCPASWETMTGDQFVRHCAQCDKNVYDLSELTAQQVIDLIREKEGTLCAKLYRRADGRVLTADCPVGIRDQLRRAIRRTLAIAASVFSFGLLVGCDDQNASSTESQFRTSAASTGKGRTPHLMGKVCIPPERDNVPGKEKAPPPNDSPDC